MQEAVRIVRDAMERLSVTHPDVDPIDIAVEVVESLGIEFVGYVVDDQFTEHPGGFKVYRFRGEVYDY